MPYYRGVRHLLINTNHTIKSGDKRSTYATCTKCKTDTIVTLTHLTPIIILFVKKNNFEGKILKIGIFKIILI